MSNDPPHRDGAALHKRAVYTPAETAQLGLRHVERSAQNATRAARFFISPLQGYFRDVLPGEIVAIQAQTHNYKSGFIDAWESALAAQLVAQGRTDEIIIHCDFETVIEHQAARAMAKIVDVPVGDVSRGQVPDMDLVKAAVSRIGGVPIYRIGASLGRNSIGFDDLYLSNVFRAIEYIKSDSPDPDNRLHDRPRHIAAIFFDYLQATPYDPEIRRAPYESQRRLQVRSDVYRIRAMTAKLETPAFVGLQAKQVLEGAPHRDFYIPGIYDGKETSDIGERFDRMISLWMPKVSHAHLIGEFIDYRNISFPVEPWMLWMKVNKQRGGLPSGQSFPCRIDFTHNTITYDPELVTRR